MLLAIDIGNTNITFGVFKGDRIIKRFNIPTKVYSLKRLKRSVGHLDLADAIICSVVPHTTKVLQKSLRAVLSGRIYILGKDIKVPIKNCYRNPKQVGSDRLVNAHAGIRLFGAPLIVVDFGTAITFDIVSKNKEYLGGLILPGLNISLEALAEKTALLPKINLKSPRELIGRDTKNSILSGLVYGFSVLVDGLIQKIKTKINKNLLVVGTGGNISFISGYCRQFNRIEPDLTLKGLNFIYGDTLSFTPKSASRLVPRVALSLKRSE